MPNARTKLDAAIINRTEAAAARDTDPRVLDKRLLRIIYKENMVDAVLDDL